MAQYSFKTKYPGKDPYAPSGEWLCECIQNWTICICRMGINFLFKSVCIYRMEIHFLFRSVYTNIHIIYIECISGEQINAHFLLRTVSHNMLWTAGYAHIWHTPLTPYQLPVCMSGANSSIWYLLRIFISTFGVYHRSPRRLWWYLSTTSGVELSPDFFMILYYMGIIYTVL